MAALKMLGFFLICIALVNSVQGIGRIVGGTETTIGKHPHQASLQYLRVSVYSHTCGASIISTKFLLSAAHCNPGANLNTMYARVGSTSYNTGGQVLKVKDFIPHPKYSRLTLDYDFGVVPLSQEIILGANVAIIPLAEAGTTKPNPNSLVTVSGWGVTSEASGAPPLKLREVDLPVVEQTVCKRTYFFLTSRQICFGGTKEGMLSACFGDSGGPAVQNGVQYALVSGGSSCEKPNIPGIYAKISMVRDWIKQQTGV